MSKKQGWDNDQHHKAIKKEGENYEQRENVKSFQRKPYDPNLEVVKELIGRVELGRNTGIFIHVEISSYDNGAEHLLVRKTRRDGGFNNLGTFWPEQAELLAKALTTGVKMLDLRKSNAVLAKEAEKQKVKDAELIRKVAGK
jgi:hypothetical protein